MNIALGRDFSIALCEHVGVDLARALDVEINAARDEILSATVKLSLNADDLAAVAQRMRDRARLSEAASAEQG